MNSGLGGLEQAFFNGGADIDAAVASGAEFGIGKNMFSHEQYSSCSF
jgi:hypothetical protein